MDRGTETPEPHCIARRSDDASCADSAVVNRPVPLCRAHRLEVAAQAAADIIATSRVVPGARRSTPADTPRSPALSDHVVAFLHNAGEALSRRQLLAALTDAGITATPNAVSAALKRRVATGDVVDLGYGMWVHAEHADAATT